MVVGVGMEWVYAVHVQGESLAGDLAAVAETQRVAERTCFGHERERRSTGKI